MYADSMTGSMSRAINETDRRRAKQEAYNAKNGITPATVEKAIRDIIQSQKPVSSQAGYYFQDKDISLVPKRSIPQLVAKMRKEMKQASRDLEFERAALLRDMIFELEAKVSPKTKN